MENTKTVTVDKSSIIPGNGGGKRDKSKSRSRSKPSKGLTRKHLLKKLKKLSMKYPLATEKEGSNKEDDSINSHLEDIDTCEVNDQFKDSLHALDELVKHYHTRKRKKLNKDNVNHDKTTNILETNYDDYGKNDDQYSSEFKSLDKKHNITPRSNSGSHQGDKSPSYGCLKFGSKPTFRQLNKTKKNKSILFPKSNMCDVVSIGEIDNKLQSRKELLADVRNQVQNELKHAVEQKAEDTKESSHVGGGGGGIPSISNPVPNPVMNTASNIVSNLSIPSKPKKILHRVKKTRKVGKKGNKVVILIDNNKTRKKKADEIVELNNMPLSKVKAYLRSKMLIKSVCTAPEHVLREMMKNAILSGDVKNHPDSVTVDHYVDRDKVNEENDFLFSI